MPVWSIANGPNSLGIFGSQASLRRGEDVKARPLHSSTSLHSQLQCPSIDDWISKFGLHLVKAMVFPVLMYGCESWNVKKAEHRIIFFFNFIFKLYIIVLVLPNIEMNPPQV